MPLPEGKIKNQRPLIGRFELRLQKKLNKMHFLPKNPKTEAKQTMPQ
jgi:hypothetical protein